MRVTASCKFPGLERWKEMCEGNPILDVIDSTLAGFAQIAFNDNTIAGIIMIAATGIAYPEQAISGVWSTFVATLVALAIGVPKGLIRCGLYGFNAALLGVAIPVVIFPGAGITMGLFIYDAIGASLTVVITAGLSNFFSKWNVSPLSMAYCITMTLIAPASVLISTMNVTRGAPTLAGLADPVETYTIMEFIDACLSGIAQVLWVEKPISGILYIVAICFASRLDVAVSVLGVVTGTGTAIAIGLPKDTVMLGLWGYNAVLLMKVVARGFRFDAHSIALGVLLATATTIVGAGMRVIFLPLGMGSVYAWPYVILCVLVFTGRDKFSRLTYIPAKNWGVPETLSQGFEDGSLDLD